MGKAIFCGKVKRRKKKHEAPGAEDEAENDASDNEVDGSGRACRQKGWWKRGDVEVQNRRTNVPCAWMTWNGPTGWALRSACWANMDFRE
jgi:hypothetical protein